MTQKKAILYVRVSTDEQAEKGNSLKHQEERLRNHCAINGIEVVAFFKEDHSAKTFERPEFIKLLAFLKKNKEFADLLLFLKWDRFSRNAPGAYGMISILKKHKIEAQAIEQPLDLNVPENKIMLAIYLTAPEVENDRRSLNVIAGMRRALKDGRWMGVAPTGYCNKRDEGNKPCLIPSNDAPLIKYSFEQLATGQYNIEEVRIMANKKGLKISRNAFWNMTRNVVYIGKIHIPAYKDETSTVVPAKHEPIISDALYYNVQDFLTGRKRIGFPAHHRLHEQLPLRGFLKCKYCGKTLTGSASNGNGGKYYYYHCSKGCKERYKANEANDLFFGMLKEISNNKKLLMTVERVTLDDYKKNNTVQNVEVEKVEREIVLYRKRLDNAQIMMLDCQLDAVEYRNIKSKIEPELEKLIRTKSKLNIKNPLEQEILEFGIYFLNNMADLFMVADLELKQRLIGSMFPEKLIFENNEYRTNIDDGILPLLLNTSKTFTQKKERGSKKSDPLSQEVVPIGLFSNLFIEDLKKLVDIFQPLDAL